MEKVQSDPMLIFLSRNQPSDEVIVQLSFSLIGERISKQAIAQLIRDPRYLRV